MNILFTFLIPWRKINPKNHSYGFFGIIMCFVSRLSFDYNKKKDFILGLKWFNFNFNFNFNFVLFGSLRFEQ